MSSSDGTIGRRAVRCRPCSTAAARTACRTPGSSAAGRTVSRQASDLAAGGCTADDRMQAARAPSRARARSSGVGSSRPTSIVAPPSPNRLASRVDGPLPDQAPGGEDPDPVADRLDLGEQVAGEQDRQAPLVDQRPEEVEDLDDAERVDGGRRLVEDEDVGRLHQRVGDAEALLHAPRVRLDPVVRAIGQADLLEDLVHGRLGLAALQPVEARRVAQVLAAGQPAVEADGVGEVAHPPLDLARVPGRVEAGDARLAAGRLGQPEQHEDRRGLARAVLAEQAEDLARLGPRGRACRPRPGCRSASSAPSCG